jgi:hypothetical protein
MILLTKELRALKNPDEIILGSPKDIHIAAEDIILLETVKYPWGKGTHVMLRAGGNPLTFVVVETVEDILDKIKFDSF